jgi:hypothetical protein
VGYGYGYGYRRYRGPYRYNTAYRPAINPLALAEMRQYQKLVSDLNAVQRGTFAGGSESTNLARDLSAAVKPPLQHDTTQSQRLANDLVSALGSRATRHTVDSTSLARSLMIAVNHGRLPIVEGGGSVNVAETVADTEQILRYSGASRDSAHAVTTDLKTLLRL